ncbi:MAG: hypothetical protein FWH38_00820 [Treponema sp.]|nr:hypothetical protein [Treponema sp.]
MKKTLTALALAACIAAPVFSQLRMNGWGRAVWVPLFIDQKGDLRSTVQASYGEQPDFEFMFTASSTNVGVDVGVIVNAVQFNQIGNAKVWIRPNNYFKLHVGLGRVSTLRGKVESSTGAYSYARGRVTGLTAPSGKDEPALVIADGDGIFSRFNLSKMGAILEITPIEGLFIGAALAPEFTMNSGLLAKDVYRGLHAAAGYEIKDVGHFRLGFIGGGSENDPQGKVGNASQNWDFSWDRRVEAAFALTAFPGVLADFGFKYSLEKHPGTLDQPGFSLENPLYLALGLMYTGIDNLSLGFAIDGHFAGKASISDGDRTTSAPQIAFNIYPTYNIGFCDIGADFTFGFQTGDEEGINDKQMLGFGVHAQKQYGHGNLRIGVYANAPMNEGQKWGMSIPVWVTYSF